MRPIKSTVALFFAFGLVGCTSSPRTPTDYSVYAKTYDAACAPEASLYVDVAPPRCIGDRFGLDEGFESDFDFQVCRISVDNFVSALDSFRSCKIDSSVAKFNQVIEGAKRLINCYETQIDSLDSEILPSYDCPPVSVPETAFMSVHFPSDVTHIPSTLVTRYSFDIPDCATSKMGFDSERLWRSSYKIESCKRELEAYLSDSWSSPEVEKSKYINNLNMGISTYKSRAVSVFNCKAGRGSYCKGRWGN